MNAILLSAFQTEPWSLVLLGAGLFALSSLARRRRSTVAAAHTPGRVASGPDGNSNDGGEVRQPGLNRAA